MSLDAARMARFAAESIDQLEELMKDDPGAELGEILIVAEIKNITMDSDTGTAVRFACTDDRFWVQRGLLESALDTIGD